MVLLMLLGFPAVIAWGHHPKGVTYPVYQFSASQLPVIDGNPRDWENVSGEYLIDGSHLMDTVMGKGKNMDPEDLAVEVKVGWSPETNRLYFLYKFHVLYQNDFSL